MYLRTILQNLLDSHQTEILETDKLNLLPTSYPGAPKLQFRFGWVVRLRHPKLLYHGQYHLGAYWERLARRVAVDHSINQEEMHAFCRATTIRAPLRNCQQTCSVKTFSTTISSKPNLSHKLQPNPNKAGTSRDAASSVALRLSPRVFKLEAMQAKTKWT